jgi:hypothetical protein
MAARDHIARHSNYDDTKDFIPTPPYATRVLFEVVAPIMKQQAPDMTIWDPACGAGHMCRVFEEYGARSLGSDIMNHGYPKMVMQDFTQKSQNEVYSHADAIVTNPPYAYLNDFIVEGLDRATKHFALLTRIQAVEGQNRFKNVFSRVPPMKVAVFSDRIPFKTGVVVRKASKMFTHVWLYWDVEWLRKDKGPYDSKMQWIEPDAQARFEKDSDYA